MLKTTPKRVIAMPTEAENRKIRRAANADPDALPLTDAQLKAEILSYSRTQGVFAGINLSGGVLRDDKNDNVDLYGKGVSPQDVLKTNIPVPAEAKPFVDALKR